MASIIAAALKSWLPVQQNNDFPIQNLPFGVFKTAQSTPRMATIIGDTVIDLQQLAKLGLFDDMDLDKTVFSQRYINDFMALGKAKTSAFRLRLAEIFAQDNKAMAQHAELRARALFPLDKVELLLPVKVGDYTDFYSSIEHATNVGTMFRDPDNALLPNWRHLPVGYHGRASSIVVSGTPIHRPKGQQKPNDGNPVFGPSKLLDFELEMAFVIGKENPLGKRVNTTQAEDYIFGLLLFNDWSARDIQKWEYIPLGPFLAKSFASTVSPWVVSLDAFEDMRVKGPKQDPEVLPYLQYEGKKNYNIELEVSLKTAKGAEKTICQSNFKYMYWNMAQQLAHHTVNGCNVQVGDLCASGTISGKEPSSYGSMLELSWRGTRPIDMPDGSQRKFLQDGDELSLSGYGYNAEGVRIGFGPCTGKILPALD
ncbi:fumarylacetoacetase [Saprospira grandis DSM 2844]|uniref:fumarylacetoacetase n=1 Tax=Saprospira grandis DSM 2844 TaxID=694433 RepID=J1I105_9BACT|nr:fumarylacetoacetase [Saprospira grandis]EJF52355.1 fumarylacetoacetase [Saprospira grandis DSM 2844]